MDERSEDHRLGLPLASPASFLCASYLAINIYVFSLVLYISHLNPHLFKVARLLMSTPLGIAYRIASTAITSVSESRS